MKKKLPSIFLDFYPNFFDEFFLSEIFASACQRMKKSKMSYRKCVSKIIIEEFNVEELMCKTPKNRHTT